MEHVSPEIKHLLKEKKIGLKKKDITPSVAVCEDRAHHQIFSYLKLIMNRLTETEKINEEILKQEETVAEFLKLIQGNRHANPYFNDFEDLE